MEKASKDILEEKVLPERNGVLTSKRYTTTEAGTVLRETRIAFCDWCGKRLDENGATIICKTCGRKLCPSPSCAIVYEGKHYCEDDLQRLLPLTTSQFKIIHGLVNELDVNEIKDLTHSRKEEFHSALNDITSKGYIEKKGVSLFSSYKVLDRAILAWRTYYEAFSKKGDVAHFIEEVENQVREVGEDANKRHARNAR